MELSMGAQLKPITLHPCPECLNMKLLSSEGQAPCAPAFSICCGWVHSCAEPLSSAVVKSSLQGPRSKKGISPSSFLPFSTSHSFWPLFNMSHEGLVWMSCLELSFNCPLFSAFYSAVSALSAVHRKQTHLWLRLNGYNIYLDSGST